MTEKEKDRLIAKMLEAPASLTDEELDIILLDEELKDIYECSAAVKGAYMSRVGIDVSREWKLFRRKLAPRRSPARWMMRVAAIFLGVVLAAGIIMKIAGPGVPGNDRRIVADAGLPEGDTARAADVEIGYADDAATIPGVADAEAEHVAVVAAPVRTARREAGNANAEAEIDADEYLRLEQDEIDHEIALINAEFLLDRHESMMEFIEYINCDPTDEKDANIIIL